MKGLVLIAARQKRIKTPDCLEFGWSTVDEYEDDVLASDDDDAKWLGKAEKAAGAKANKKKRMVTQKSGGLCSQEPTVEATGVSTTAASQAPTPGPPGMPPLLQQGRPPRIPDPVSIILPRDGTPMGFLSQVA